MSKWITKGMLATLVWLVYKYRKESLEHYDRMEKMYGYDER